MIEVLSSTALASVQDQGYRGSYRYGVCRGGAMDRLALEIGNVLLGNDRRAAGIEIQLTPFKLRFDEPLSFALTGADCDATLDDAPILPNWALDAAPGQILTLNSPRAGVRAYLAVAGGIDVPEILGSRSTQIRDGFGGFEGRTLAKGDRLRACGSLAGLPEGGLGAVLPSDDIIGRDADGTLCLRVLPAAEYDMFTRASQQRLQQARWSVTRQSNRAGYRLQGPQPGLELTGPLELRSHGIMPGVIQVPPSGQPIIQLADAATMGGYPKIGTVIDADLWRIAQSRVEERIRFEIVTPEDALAAGRELDIHVARVAASAALRRASAQNWRTR